MCLSLCRHVRDLETVRCPCYTQGRPCAKGKPDLAGRRCLAFDYIPLHYITFHYITLHTLHTLQYTTYITHITLHDITYITHITLHYTTFTLHYIRVSSKSVKQECPARASSKRVLSRVPCKTLLLLDDCASHLHKDKTSIFIFALVSVYSSLHKVTAFGFVGSIRFGFFHQNMMASCWLPTF